MHSMHSALLATLGALPALAAVIPSEAGQEHHLLRERQALATICGQYDSTPAAAFTLDNNLWGEGAGSGSQCTSLDYDNGNTVSWQTSWSWSGSSSSVKSYANAVLNIEATQLSSIGSMPTTWNWTYTGDSIIGDVSYDAFFSSQADTNAAHDYEVMVWLDALGGAEPIGYGSPAATPNIDGVTWNLYIGQGSGNGFTTFSFVAPNTINNFSGDINNFFTYLTQNQGVPSSYYLQYIGAGTEAFTGSNALFTVSPYTLSLS